MYSNIITPPDFSADEFHTVTVIGATQGDIDLLVDYCRHADLSYNIYIYDTSMNNRPWLDSAISRSRAVILLDDGNSYRELLDSGTTYYVGDSTYVCPSIKIGSVLDYFTA